jgi:hypothetical protein
VLNLLLCIVDAERFLEAVIVGFWYSPDKAKSGAEPDKLYIGVGEVDEEGWDT